MIADLADGGQLPLLAAAVERSLEDTRHRAGRGELVALPSRAEIAVLRLLCTDLSVRQIGQELFLSSNTVRSHTRSVYRKLGVNSRAEAVARATVLGLFDKPQSPM